MATKTTPDEMADAVVCMILQGPAVASAKHDVAERTLWYWKKKAESDEVLAGKIRARLTVRTAQVQLATARKEATWHEARANCLESGFGHIKTIHERIAVLADTDTDAALNLAKVSELMSRSLGRFGDLDVAASVLNGSGTPGTHPEGGGVPEDARAVPEAGDDEAE
jgi:hypothetical protein